jgi:hypothetical protein
MPQPRWVHARPKTPCCIDQLQDILSSVLENLMTDLIELHRKHLWRDSPMELTRLRAIDAKTIEIGEITIKSPFKGAQIQRGPDDTAATRYLPGSNQRSLRSRYQLGNDHTGLQRAGKR